MSEIETIYVVNHSHTDIGYTDFQDICFQQHGEFVREALDLIEATADAGVETTDTPIIRLVVESAARTSEVQAAVLRT